MELKDKKCVPCEGGAPVLSESQRTQYLPMINKKWQIIGERMLARDFHFVNFRHTMNFVNQVAEIAEAEGHHPDMHISYGKCRIELWTHAIGGLSENDFIVAAKINMLKG